jgi:Zn finger protein HypA/HybF involved in hydrogenase expression
MFIKNKIMKQVEQSMPTANIAINKSRIKVYKKNSDMPTYYLKKGQEFQIELFNPTSDIILAKISLNNKAIAQGGLVLKPGQRVFLDRYIDVAKKFKFDTYEVANTSEVKEAIKENGDFKVEFYKQQQHRPHLRINTLPSRSYFGDPYLNQPVYGSTSAIGYNADITTTSLGSTTSGDITLDSLSLDDVQATNTVSTSAGGQATRSRKVLKSKKSKSIETGRVEMGTNSDQKLETVHYDFEHFSFHTITYKMLPVSQKVNTVKDTKVARYCVECGNKQKPNNKFCPNCGNRV